MNKIKKVDDLYNYLLSTNNINEIESVSIYDYTCSNKYLNKSNDLISDPSTDIKLNSTNHIIKLNKPFFIYSLDEQNIKSTKGYDIGGGILVFLGIVFLFWFYIHFKFGRDSDGILIKK